MFSTSISSSSTSSYFFAGSSLSCPPFSTSFSLNFSSSSHFYLHTHLPLPYLQHQPTLGHNNHYMFTFQAIKDLQGMRRRQRRRRRRKKRKEKGEEGADGWWLDRKNGIGLRRISHGYIRICSYLGSHTTTTTATTKPL